MKVMLVKTQNEDKPCIVYNNEPLKFVECFRYLGLEVLLIIHRMNMVLIAHKQERELLLCI